MGNGTTQQAMNSPYRGLTPYTEADAAYFFGRTHEVATIMASLEVARLTLFYGPSGVGKSSVLRAGVLHQLQQQTYTSVRRYGRADFIPVYFNRWQTDPLTGLAQAIETAIIDCGLPTADWPRASGDSTRPLPLTAFLTTWSNRTQSDLLLIFDQFEEYFLYHPPANDAGDFAHELVQAMNSLDLRVNFLLSLREDALSRLDRFKGQIPFLLDNRLSIGHLGRRAGKEAVVRPLAQYNQEHGTRIMIEPGLVEAVLNQVGSGQVALSRQGVGGRNVDGEQIEAPYLQLVLTRLWEEECSQGSTQLCQSTLDGLGGAATIVRNYLGDTLHALEPAERTLAARFFDRLVTPSGAKIALSLDELAYYAEGDRNEVEQVIQQLQDRRLVRGIQSPTGAVQYEIFHDVLGQPLLDWQARYQKAQEEEERLAEEQAARAQAEKRILIETRHNQRLRWLLAGIVVLAVIAVGLAFIALNQARDAFVRQLAAQASDLAGTEADTAFLLAREAYQRQHSELVDARSALLAAQQCCADNVVAFLRGHSDRVWDVTFHPTMPLLASGSDDGTIVIWDLTSQRPIRTINNSTTGASIYTVAFSHDGKLLAAGDGDGAIWLRDTTRWLPVGQPLRGHAYNVHSLAFSADDKLLVSGGADKRVIVWNMATHWEITRSVSHQDWVWDVAIAPDNRTVASASRDRTVQLWDIGAPSAGMVTHTVTITPQDGQVVTSVAFNSSVDQPLLATGNAGNSPPLKIWDMRPWQQNRARPAEIAKSSGDFNHTRTIWGIGFSPVDPTLLASSSESGVVRVWRVNPTRINGQPTLSPLSLGLAAGTTGLFRLAFSPDGKTIATGGLDWLVTLWQRDESQSVIRHADNIRTIRLLPDQKTLLTLSADAKISAWDVAKRQPRNEMVALNGITSIGIGVISPDGAIAATADVTKPVTLWDVGTGQPLNKTLPLTTPVRSLLFSPDSNLLAVGEESGNLSLWQIQSSEPASRWQAHPGLVDSLAFRRDGAVLASGGCGTLIESRGSMICGRGEIRLWSVTDGQPYGAALKGQSGAVTALTFHPRQPSVLAVGTGDGTVMTINLDKPDARLNFGLRGQRIRVLTFSPDGRYLAVGKNTYEFGLYDTTTVQPFGKTFRDHDAAISALLFHPNGELLFSGSDDDTVVVHDLWVDAWLERACRVANRNFTQAEWQRYFGGSYQRTCPEFSDGP